MEAKPIRVQRKRVKGWKMPDNTVSVTRPGRWGNPFAVTSQAFANRDHWQVVGPGRDYWTRSYSKPEATEKAVELYKDWVTEKIRNGELALAELRGKNLACFCIPGTPCHADVLLELANWCS